MYHSAVGFECQNTTYAIVADVLLQLFFVTIQNIF